MKWHAAETVILLDLSYVESEPEDSDVDLENDDDEIEDSENGSNKQNVLNKCANCNFEAKNTSGLKIHMKTIHFKTTTKLILKKHVKDKRCIIVLVCQLNFPAIWPILLIYCSFCAIS